jgi:hypothetical protein
MFLQQAQRDITETLEMKMEKLKNTVVDLTVFSSLVKEEAYHD